MRDLQHLKAMSDAGILASSCLDGEKGNLSWRTFLGEEAASSHHRTIHRAVSFAPRKMYRQLQSLPAAPALLSCRQLLCQGTLWIL